MSEIHVVITVRRRATSFQLPPFYLNALDAGARPSGFPPGPLAKLIHGIEARSPTPGFE